MTPERATGANPFSTRSALILILGGAILLVTLLWMIGSGLGAGPANDGGNHGAGRGLNGYAAFYRLLERNGYNVRRARSEATFGQTNLLVLTPPHAANASELNRIVSDRRRRGPTLLILPKWQAVPLPAAIRPPEARQGWVALGNALSPSWAERIPSLGPLDARVDRGTAGWSGLNLSGTLPDAAAVQSLSSGRVTPVVRDTRGRILAGLLEDGNDYGVLSWASGEKTPRVEGSSLYPLVVVAEPDLFDNYGFARQDNAALAMALVAAMTQGERMPIVFDLTLNGHVHKANLLTLAFTPPFLAATLCLLLAALVIGWRAFLRFGPPRKSERAIAFGKRALVINSAGLIRRTRRLHLLTGPYADHARDSLARALGIGRQPDYETTEAAIDRALRSRAPHAMSFSQIAARLRGAKSPQQAISAARDLHALERKLIR